MTESPQRSIRAFWVLAAGLVLALLVAGVALARDHRGLLRAEAMLEQLAVTAAEGGGGAVVPWSAVWLADHARRHQLSEHQREQISGCMDDYLQQLDRVAARENVVRFDRIEQVRRSALECVQPFVGDTAAERFTEDLTRRWSGWRQESEGRGPANRGRQGAGAGSPASSPGARNR